MILNIHKAALYARYSSDNQRSESITAQMRAMEEYCQRNNILVVARYTDEAKSGTNDRRESFQQMIEDSKKHEFDIVLVHKLDRFARDRYDSIVYQRILKKNGVTLYSVLENLDDSPESIILQSVLEGMNQYYSENLARETRKGLKENALQCKHTGGKPPYGFNVDKETKLLVINEEEAETVRLIFYMYARGYGYTSILKVLNEKGVFTRSGKNFRKENLYDMFTNPKYKGTYVYNRRSSKSAKGTRNNHSYKDPSEMIVIEGGCPQIIDNDTFQAVAKRINEHKHFIGKEYGSRLSHLLTGKIFCGECGKSMSGNRRFSGRNKSEYITYRCLTLKKVCGNREINQGYIDAYVVHTIEENILNKKSLKKIKANIMNCLSKKDGPVTEYAKTEEALIKNAKEIDNIANAIAEGHSSSIIISKLTDLEKEREVLLSKIETLPPIPSASSINIDIDSILLGYKESKKVPYSPEHKVFLHQFINKIVVGRYKIFITIKTGLDIIPDLDTTITVRREEIYAFGKEKKATTT